MELVGRKQEERADLPPAVGKCAFVGLIDNSAKGLIGGPPPAGSSLARRLVPLGSGVCEVVEMQTCERSRGQVGVVGHFNGSEDLVESECR